MSPRGSQSRQCAGKMTSVTFFKQRIKHAVETIHNRKQSTGLCTPDPLRHSREIPRKPWAGCHVNSEPRSEIQEGGKSDSFKTVWNISQNKDTDFLGTVAWIWELPATCKRWTNHRKLQCSQGRATLQPPSLRQMDSVLSKPLTRMPLGSP